MKSNTFEADYYLLIARITTFMHKCYPELTYEEVHCHSIAMIDILYDGLRISSDIGITGKLPYDVQQSYATFIQ